MAAGLPSWDSCVFNSMDQCGRAYLGAAIGLGLLVTGFWIFRDLLLDALSDAWPRLWARLPRRWFLRAGAMPAVLVADQIHAPAHAGRLWYGATLTGSDPPPPDPETAQQGLAAIAKHDLSFRPDELVDRARRALPVVLRAWIDQDPRVSHRVMAALIWEQQKEDIAVYRADGRRNILDGLTVRDAAVVGAASNARYDTVVIRFNLAAADYDVAIDTRAVVRGSPSTIAWAEDWVFQRPLTGSQRANGPSACPQCGAPIDPDVAGVCSHCDAELNGPPPDWLLTRIDVVPDAAWPQVA